MAGHQKRRGTKAVSIRLRKVRDLYKAGENLCDVVSYIITACASVCEQKEGWVGRDSLQDLYEYIERYVIENMSPPRFDGVCACAPPEMQWLYDEDAEIAVEEVRRFLDINQSLVYAVIDVMRDLHKIGTVRARCTGWKFKAGAHVLEIAYAISQQQLT